MNSTKLNRCLFNLNQSHYYSNGFTINFIETLFCSINNDNYILYLLISALILSFIFTGLGVASNDFLCSSLLVISKNLKLSQNIAGVTFLAFGNGAPDIFSCLVGIKQARPELVFGEIFGAGIFVTTVVAGSILSFQNFSIMQRPLLRDIFFYITASYLAWYICWTEKIDLFLAISFIIIYAVYILMVIISRMIHNLIRSSKKKILSLEENSPSKIDENTQLLKVFNSIPSPIKNVYQTPRKYSDPLPIVNYKDLIFKKKSTPIYSSYSTEFKNRISYYLSNSYTINNETLPSYYKLENNSIYENHIDLRPSCNHLFSRLMINGSDFSNKLDSESDSDEINSLDEFEDLLFHIIPFKLNTLNNNSKLAKALIILVQIWKAPFSILFSLTIPVVDYEVPKNNWCRMLNCIHLITSPLIIVILTKNLNVKLFNEISIIELILIIGLLSAFILYKTTKNDAPPSFHLVFAYIGFIISVLWIYSLVQELVDLIRAIGFIFKLSDAILGLTVLTWGNCLGDLITNLSIAKQGFPKMGLSVCFGGPLLTLLLGIGISYTVILAHNGGQIDLKYTKMVSLLFGTLFLSLVITLFASLYNKFKSKLWHGVLLIILYIIYLIAAIFIEINS